MTQNYSDGGLICAGSKDGKNAHMFSPILLAWHVFWCHSSWIQRFIFHKTKKTFERKPLYLLHKKWSYPWRISSVNGTKSAGNLNKYRYKHLISHISIRICQKTFLQIFWNHDFFCDVSWIVFIVAKHSVRWHSLILPE